MKETLRALRIENGLTQKELAKILKSSDKNIWNYEKGLATPPYDILVAYADYFEVTTDYLIGRTDDFDAPNAALMGDSLTTEERRIINQYRALPDKIKKIIREQIEVYSEPNELLSKHDKKV